MTKNPDPNKEPLLNDAAAEAATGLRAHTLTKIAFECGGLGGPPFYMPDGKTPHYRASEVRRWIESDLLPGAIGFAHRQIVEQIRMGADRPRDPLVLADLENREKQRAEERASEDKQRAAREAFENDPARKQAGAMLDALAQGTPHAQREALAALIRKGEQP